MSTESINESTTESLNETPTAEVGTPLEDNTLYNLFISPNSVARRWVLVTSYARNNNVSILNALQVEWKSLSDDDKETFKFMCDHDDKECYDDE